MIKDAPAVVKQNALTIINSLICYPNHFDGLAFPVAVRQQDCIRDTIAIL
jgi:hypothetical protein